MSFQKIANVAKQRNVLDMALSFTAMIRLFEKDAKAKILNRLLEFCGVLPRTASSTLFEERHHEFCLWFTENIVTAERIGNAGIPITSAPASYGQAAKVLDAALKVYVFYTRLPATEVSAQIVPFLHAAIDNQILDYLKVQFQPLGVTANTIADMDETQYRLLQRLIGRDLIKTFQSEILPVEYDDIIWSKLNREF